MTTKKCSKCEKEKNINDFFFKNKEKDKRHSYCKECKRELDRKSYHENKNGRKDKVKENRQKHIDKKNEFYKNYKKGCKCEKCGDERHYVLEFHHTHDKEFNISHEYRNVSFKKLKQELEKCITLCANCHRELHYFERQKKM